MALNGQEETFSVFRFLGLLQTDVLPAQVLVLWSARCACLSLCLSVGSALLSRPHLVSLGILFVSHVCNLHSLTFILPRGYASLFLQTFYLNLHRERHSECVCVCVFTKHLTIYG